MCGGLYELEDASERPDISGSEKKEFGRYVAVAVACCENCEETGKIVVIQKTRE